MVVMKHEPDPLGCAAAGVPWDMTDPHYDYIWPDGQNPYRKTSEVGLSDRHGGCLGTFTLTEQFPKLYEFQQGGVAVPAPIAAAALSNYRTAHGLTQQELGDLIGMHPSYISNIERQRYAYTYTATFERIARALGVEILDLLAYADRD